MNTTPGAGEPPLERGRRSSSGTAVGAVSLVGVAGLGVAAYFIFRKKAPTSRPAPSTPSTPPAPTPSTPSTPSTPPAPPAPPADSAALTQARAAADEFEQALALLSENPTADGLTALHDRVERRMVAEMAGLNVALERERTALLAAYARMSAVRDEVMEQLDALDEEAADRVREGQRQLAEALALAEPFEVEAAEFAASAAELAEAVVPAAATIASLLAETGRPAAERLAQAEDLEEDILEALATAEGAAEGASAELEAFDEVDTAAFSEAVRSAWTEARQRVAGSASSAAASLDRVRASVAEAQEAVAALGARVQEEQAEAALRAGAEEVAKWSAATAAEAAKAEAVLRGSIQARQQAATDYARTYNTEDATERLDEEAAQASFAVVEAGRTIRDLARQAAEIENVALAQKTRAEEALALLEGASLSDVAAESPLLAQARAAAQQATAAYGRVGEIRRQIDADGAEVQRMESNIRPVDCVTEWAPWEEVPCLTSARAPPACGQPGTQVRGKRVLRPANAFGEPCDAATASESRACQGDPCPIDCEVAPPDWDALPCLTPGGEVAECGTTGAIKRGTPRVVRQPMFGGAGCGDLSEIEQPCTPVCGAFKDVRVRSGVTVRGKRMKVTRLARVSGILQILGTGASIPKAPRLVPTDAAEPASKQYADKALQGFPVGAVIPYGGALADIPANWAICDGTRGTPNMVGRFVRGASSASGLGMLGGRASWSMAAGEVAKHSHKTLAMRDNQKPVVNETGSHTHSFTGEWNKQITEIALKSEPGKDSVPIYWIQPQAAKIREYRLGSYSTATPSLGIPSLPNERWHAWPPHRTPDSRAANGLALNVLADVTDAQIAANPTSATYAVRKRTATERSRPIVNKVSHTHTVDLTHTHDVNAEIEPFQNAGAKSAPLDPPHYVLVFIKRVE